VPVLSANAPRPPSPPSINQAAAGSGTGVREVIVYSTLLLVLAVVTPNNPNAEVVAAVRTGAPVLVYGDPVEFSI